MTMEKISSLQNAKIKNWALLHKKKHRDETGLFLVEGEHLINEALAANAVETIVTDTTSPFDFEHVVEVTPAIMAKLSENVSNVHYIAVCHQRKLDITKQNRLLLLDGILVILVRLSVPQFHLALMVCIVQLRLVTFITIKRFVLPKAHYSIFPLYAKTSLL